MPPSTTQVEPVPNSHADSIGPSTSVATSRKRRRRVAFACLTILLFCFFIEFVAFAVYGLIDGHPFSYVRAQGERDALMQSSVSSASASAGNRATAPDFLRSKSLHPYVGYVATPNENSTASENFGYYDGNPIRKRSPDTVIVAIVGGSVAYGFGIPAAKDAHAGIDMLKEQLLASPRYAGKQIVFLRLAISGYKQPQQLMTISWLLSLGAEFDVVINIDGFNEVALHPAENANTGTFAAYPRMWSFQTGDRRELDGKYEHLNYSRRDWSEFFSCPVLSKSVTANLIWKVRDRSLAREIYDLQRSSLNDKSAVATYEATGPARHYANDDAMIDDLVTIWKNSSIQLERLCRANGIKYHHVLQPNQYVPGSKKLTLDEMADAYDATQLYRIGAEKGYPRLIGAGEELKQAGVHFLDLSQAFADVNETLYVDTCCHFNDKGYAILAERIAKEMLADFSP